jgi:3-oxoacyl-[acyl-carrier protein] reductase
MGLRREEADVEGRVAVVTGAAQGLGEAIARALAEAGARVVLADRNEAGAQEVAAELGDRARAVAVDVRDRESLRGALDAAEAAFGGLDILVNNAARTVSRPVWEIEADEWDDVLATNLRSVLFGCQLAGPRLRERGWGRIVNLSSLAGQQGGAVAGAHYAASKAGIIVLTKIVAGELAPHGVTVNAVAPAAIDGPAMAAMPPERVEALARRIPVGRVGRPEEVGALVAFLCSEHAGYVTGATYDVNGGLFMR